MKVKHLVPIALIAVSVASLPQNGTSHPETSTDSSAHHLQVTRSANIAFTGVMAGKAKCDISGHVYVRLMSKEMGDRVSSTLPVQKIRPDGSIAGTFGIDNLSADLRAIAFFVSPDGTVSFAPRSDLEANVYFVSYPKGPIHQR